MIVVLLFLAVAVGAGVFVPDRGTALRVTGGFGLLVSIPLAIAWVGFLISTVPGTGIALGITWLVHRVRHPVPGGLPG